MGQSRPMQSAAAMPICFRPHGRRESKRIPFWHVEESKCGPCGMRHRILIITIRSALFAMRMKPRSAKTAAPGGIWERPARNGAKPIDQCRNRYGSVPQRSKEQEVISEEARNKRDSAFGSRVVLHPRPKLTAGPRDRVMYSAQPGCLSHQMQSSRSCGQGWKAPEQCWASVGCP